jgi:DNA-binding winged helix-turn-helix (wHTH) protein
VLFSFKDFALDAERRELRARGTIVAIEPQVFDLLVYLIQIATASSARMI